MEWIPLPESPPATIEAFVDGQSYTLAGGRLRDCKNYEPVVFFDGVRHTASLAEVGLFGTVVIKLVTDEARRNFRDNATSNSWFPPSNFVRGPGRIERARNFEALLAKYPGFQSALHHGRELVHYLLIYKLQQERMSNNPYVEIPSSRFVVVGTPEAPQAAIVQQRVSGRSLMQLLPTKPGSAHSIHPTGVAAIRSLVKSDFCRHVNWYPENFIWAKENQRFYYVESKPTTMIGRDVNNTSINNLRIDLAF